jgi:hypothetical protein
MALSVMNQMSDIFLIIFFVSILIGLKKIVVCWYCRISHWPYMLFFTINFYNHQWVFIPVTSYVVGLILPLSVRWIFSGYRGGRGKTNPGVIYIGGFGVAENWSPKPLC